MRPQVIPDAHSLAEYRSEPTPHGSRRVSDGDNPANSSAIFSLTVTGESDDVLAFVRTAMVLGHSIGSSIWIDLPCEPVRSFEPQIAECRSRIDNLLLSIESRLLEAASAGRHKKFSIEMGLTTGSFLTGSISLQVRCADHVPEHSSALR